MSIIERFKSYILWMHGVGINKHNAGGGEGYQKGFIRMSSNVYTVHLIGHNERTRMKLHETKLISV